MSFGTAMIPDPSSRRLVTVSPNDTREPTIQVCGDLPLLKGLR